MRKLTIELQGTILCLSWVEGGQRWSRRLRKITTKAAEEIRSPKETELKHGLKILARSLTVRQLLDPYCDWYDAGHPTT